MRHPLIELRGLSKVYAPSQDEATTSADKSLLVNALNKVDLSIERGEYVAIIGPSGSGKSTLMQLLGLLDRPSAGTYRFAGKDTSTLDDNELSELRSKEIGFIFQSFNLLTNATAAYNVELPLIYRGMRERKHRVAELLKKVGLGHRMLHFPLQLSGGQQQRVAVARSLANHPQIIFADEPTGNLNQESAQEIMGILADLNRQGVTLIVVTHDPSIAAKARRIITIVDGRIQADERRSQAAQHPASESSVPSTPAAPPAPRAELGVLFENIRMAVKSLSANTLRTALSALGILIGVASVITMVALGQGARQAIAEDLKRLGSNLLTIRPDTSRISPLDGRRTNTLSLADVAALKDLKEVGVPIERVEGSVYGTVQVSYGGITVSTRAQGVTHEYAALYASSPTHGRFINEHDDESRERVCLLGTTVFRAIFPEGTNPLGALIKVNRLNFRVIGLLPSKGSSSFGDRDDIIVIPLQTAMHRLFGKDRVDQIAVQVSSYEAMGFTTRTIEELLRQRHRILPEREDDFSIRNMADLQETLSSTTRTMTLLLGLIASISLLVGGIGIMNIMLVSVKERTREIGLRKALGAKSRHVLVQFLIEAVVIGACGGSIGTLLGVGASLGISASLGWAVVISPWAIVGSLLFSTGIGIIFGFWPAQQAARLSPIEALRYQ